MQPHARMKAMDTLAAAALPAARVLLQIIDDHEQTACDKCGRPTGDPGPVIRAAQIVLDRTGFHPSMTVNFKRPTEDRSWMRHLDTEELEQLSRLIAEAKARQARGETPRDEVRVINITPEQPTEAEDVGEI